MDGDFRSAARIVGIGEILWDVFPDRSCFGGAPANFAAHAAALGAEVAMVGAVGNDDLGDRAVEELTARNVSVDFVARPERPTGTVTVSLDPEGKADYVFAADAAWDAMEWDPKLERLAARTDAVCFGSLGQRDVRSCGVIQRFVAATRDDCLRIFDVNLRQHFYNDDVIEDSLFLADVLKLNDEEIDIVDPQGRGALQMDRLRAMCARYDLRLAALTRGPKGALLVTPDEVADIPGEAVEVIDTVGAGDAFTAVLAQGLLQGARLPLIGRKACEIAGHVCGCAGATPGLPERLRRPFLD
jgi:fructokinase